MAVISKLSVGITANTGGFTSGLKKAGSAVTGFASSAIKGFANIAKAGAASFLAAGAAILFFTIRAAKAIDETAKLSKQIGITTESLTAYGLAAELAGVDNATFTSSLQKFSRSIGEAKIGAGTGASALKKLGIEQKDLAGLNTDQSLNLVADALKGVTDQNKRAAIASEIFGRSGVKLLPLLSNGAAGLAEFRKEADRLGISLSKADSAKVEGAVDAFTILGKSLTGIFNKLAVEFAPIVTEISKVITNGFVFIRKTVVPIFIDFVKSALITLFEFLKIGVPIMISFGKAVFDVISGVAQFMFKAFKDIGTVIFDFVNDIGFGGDHVEGFAEKVQNAITFVRFVFKELGTVVDTILQSIISGISDTLLAILKFAKAIPLLGGALKKLEEVLGTDTESFLKELSEGSSAIIDENTDNLAKNFDKFSKKIKQENKKIAKDSSTIFDKLINTIKDFKAPELGFGGLGGAGAGAIPSVETTTKPADLKALQRGSVEAFKVIQNRGRSLDIENKQLDVQEETRDAVKASKLVQEQLLAKTEQTIILTAV